MSSLLGKVALVTGASRGIGRAISERLAAAGATIAVNYLHGSDEAAQVVESIQLSGSTSKLFQADMADPHAIRQMFDEVERTFGGLDIVIVNAALPFIGVSVVDVQEEDFDRLFALNTKGAFIVLQEAAKRVREGGRIIDISSSTTMFPAAGMGVHSASKAASKLIVETLAIELGIRQITVNSVLPGATQTAFLKDATKEELDRISHGSPLGRLGQARDIAEVVLFLASTEGAGSMDSISWRMEGRKSNACCFARRVRFFYGNAVATVHAPISAHVRPIMLVQVVENDASINNLGTT